MEKALFNKSEVADRLRISEGTLTTYGSRYPVYKADNAGVFHKDHVIILEKVRAKILTPEEGNALWQYQRGVIRKGLLGVLDDRGKTRKPSRIA